MSKWNVEGGSRLLAYDQNVEFMWQKRLKTLVVCDERIFIEPMRIQV